MKEYDDVTHLLEPKLSVTAPKPNYLLSFNNKEGKHVGGFDFNGQKMVFTGEAEESAQIFVDWIATAFAARLKEEYERGRADSLVDHGLLNDRLGGEE